MAESRVRASAMILALALATVQCSNDDELHGIGESCGGDFQCFPDLVCKGNARCARPGQQGEVCTRPEECATGLLCKGNPLTCSRPGSECDLCTRDTDCVAGLFCVIFDDGSRRCGSGTGATTCLIR
jgi:hypothetical protein